MRHYREHKYKFVGCINGHQVFENTTTGKCRCGNGTTKKWCKAKSRCRMDEKPFRKIRCNHLGSIVFTWRDVFDRFCT